jgi:hypothetical protein
VVRDSRRRQSLRVQHDTHKRTHPYSCTYALEGVGLRLYVLVAEVRRSDLDAVRHAFRACHARAVGAAVKRAVRLDAVPDHLDAAILAVGREGMYRALEAVESVRVSSGHTYLKGLIVLISTDFALGQIHLLSGSRQSPFLGWIPWVRLGQTPAKSKSRCRKMI